MKFSGSPLQLKSEILAQEKVQGILTQEEELILMVSLSCCSLPKVCFRVYALNLPEPIFGWAVGKVKR